MVMSVVGIAAARNVATARRRTKRIDGSDGWVPEDCNAAAQNASWRLGYFV
jgi:hypothetical protein